MKYTEWYHSNHKFNEQEQWIRANVLLETIVGSRAYGCETKESDFDVIVVVMPKRECIYPNDYGYITGFDQMPNFERKELKGEQSNIINKNKVEIEWISLVNFFFQAGIKGSPNMFESLFAHPTLVTRGSDIGYRLRDKRHLFLSMKTFHALKGYAYSQFHRIKRGAIVSDKRRLLIEEHGYDTAMAKHVLRLLDYLVQILTIGDLDLRRNKEELKAMKRGEWGSKEKFEDEFGKRLAYAEELARTSNLPDQPRRQELHNLLQSFIDEFYEKEETVRSEYVKASDVMEKLERIEEHICYPKLKI